MRQIRETHWSQCWYCACHVGLLGRGLAWLFGTGFHDCDFNNVVAETKERA